MTTDPAHPPVSPRWGMTTKFLISLIAVVLIGALLVRFQEMVGPMALAFILAYLFNPLVGWLTARARLPRGLTVTLVYLVLVLLVLAIIVVAGIALEQQIAGLYRALAEILANLPERLGTVTQGAVDFGPFTLDLSQPIILGPFRFDLAQTDLQPLYDQLVSAVEPVLSRTGAVVGSLASGTATFLGWTLFVLIVAFYLSHDFQNVVPSLEQVVPEAYWDDMRRLLNELGPIWNAFLRGQVTIAAILGLMVGVTMALLGVRYAPVLGLLAAVVEFLPIVGPLFSGLVGTLVALFQVGNWLGLPPFYFALLIAGVYIVIQQVENNLVVPRIMGRSLNLHPLIIIIGAVIGASLAGIVGLLLAAPSIASLRLFGRYVYRKMLDLDPWAASPRPAAPALPAPPAPPRPKPRARAKK